MPHAATKTGEHQLYQDALRPVAEIDSDGTFSQFVYTDGGSAPDFIVRVGVPLRLVKDYLGSVRFVVNAQSGKILQELAYDEFGNVTKDTNPGFQPFGFAGGLYDADTHLVRFGARDYDATTGRWVAKDPSGFGGGDTNLYGYCAGDPANYIDQDGRNPVLVGVILIGLAIAGDQEHPGKGSKELFMAGLDFLGAGAAKMALRTRGVAAGARAASRTATAETTVELAETAPQMLPGPRQIEAVWGVNTYRHGGLMTGAEHILYRHASNSGFANVSRFAEGTTARSIVGYVDEALRYGTVTQTGATAYTIEYRLGRAIGTNVAGRAANCIRVFVRDGIIQSAFPF